MKELLDLFKLFYIIEIRVHPCTPFEVPRLITFDEVVTAGHTLHLRSTEFNFPARYLLKSTSKNVELDCNLKRNSCRLRLTNAVIDI